MKWGITRLEQWTIIFLIVFINIGLAIHAYEQKKDRNVIYVEQFDLTTDNTRSEETLDHSELRSQRGNLNLEGEVEEIPSDLSKNFKVNINTAQSDDLENLPQIGPALANRIIEYRQTTGPFKTIKDIKNVSGIGDKTFDEIRDLITTGNINADNEDEIVEKTFNPSMELNESTNVFRKVNINTAGSSELEQLPGIGPSRAALIIEYRYRSGGFKTIEELKQIRGIGPKTLEKLRPFVTIE